MRIHPVPLINLHHGYRINTQRGLRVILLLVGLAVCFLVLDSSPEWNALLALANPIDPILLYPTGQIDVEYELFFPQLHMYTSPGFLKITDNQHIWAHMQTVKVEDRLGLVYYFKFHDMEEARMSLERIETSVEFVTPHEAHQFGPYTVLSIVSNEREDPASFFKTVFGQIEKNLRS